PALRAPGAARRLARPLPKAWTITSFSRLAAGLDAERPDHDATRATVAVVATPRRHDVFAFPHGARAGTCLHVILERIDFTARNRDAWAPVVRTALQAHGYEATWEPVVLDMLARVVATPLDDAGTLRLDRVDAGARLGELEFFHPIAHFDAAGLGRLLLDHGFGSAPVRDAIAQARFPSSTGFMKGFIDLVFAQGGRYWLVDYKSNRLGDTPQDYAAARLPAIVAREAYWLQYLIYTVVVHRLLRLRLADYDYERHMGGVRYLFLRGMDPAHGAACGVYQDRPSRELVQALDAFMGGGTA
ncbi:MAG: PD-(D/E)XK nuclease family protein, partial [Candidatus Binatia bacterium]